jgi:hypothetical protein
LKFHFAVSAKSRCVMIALTPGTSALWALIDFIRACA